MAAADRPLGLGPHALRESRSPSPRRTSKSTNFRGANPSPSWIPGWTKTCAKDLGGGVTLSHGYRPPPGWGWVRRLVRRVLFAAGQGQKTLRCQSLVYAPGQDAPADAKQAVAWPVNAGPFRPLRQNRRLVRRVWGSSHRFTTSTDGREESALSVNGAASPFDAPSVGFSESWEEKQTEQTVLSASPGGSAWGLNREMSARSCSDP